MHERLKVMMRAVVLYGSCAQRPTHLSLSCLHNIFVVVVYFRYSFHLDKTKRRLHAL